MHWLVCNEESGVNRFNMRIQACAVGASIEFRSSSGSVQAFGRENRLWLFESTRYPAAAFRHNKSLRTFRLDAAGAFEINHRKG